MENQSHKKRITITIGEEELDLARTSGESVSGYISRLIRDDNAHQTLKVMLPRGLSSLLVSSGLLDGERRDRLMDELVRVVVKHIDATLLDSRAKLMSISDEAILAAQAKSRNIS